MSNLKSQGCALFKGDTASPIAYTEVGQVISISGPDGSTGETDVTNLASIIKEFIPSLPDMGSVSCEASWDYADSANQHAAISADFLAQTTGDWQIRLSDSPRTVISFRGFPNAYSTSIGVDDKVGLTFGIRITDTYSIA
jgi:hypothetical protein